MTNLIRLCYETIESNKKYINLDKLENEITSELISQLGMKSLKAENNIFALEKKEGGKIKLMNKSQNEIYISLNFYHEQEKEITIAPEDFYLIQDPSNAKIYFDRKDKDEDYLTFEKVKERQNKIAKAEDEPMNINFDDLDLEALFSNDFQSQIIEDSKQDDESKLNYIFNKYTTTDDKPTNINDNRAKATKKIIDDDDEISNGPSNSNTNYYQAKSNINSILRPSASFDNIIKFDKLKGSNPANSDKINDSKNLSRISFAEFNKKQAKQNETNESKSFPIPEVKNDRVIPRSNKIITDSDNKENDRNELVDKKEDDDITDDVLYEILATYTASDFNEGKTFKKFSECGAGNYPNNFSNNIHNQSNTYNTYQSYNNINSSLYSKSSNLHINITNINSNSPYPSQKRKSPKSSSLSEIRRQREFRESTKKFGGEFNEHGKRPANFEPEFISAFKSKRLKKATDNRELRKELDATCIICLDLIKELAGLDNCNHDFCKPCIVKWSKNTNCCPLCKKEFKKIFYWENNKKKEVKVKKKKLSLEEDFEFYDVESIQESADNCLVCGGADDLPNMLVCDRCEYNVCHTYCDNLDRIPANEWYCRTCRAPGGINRQRISSESEGADEDDDYSARVVLEEDEENDVHVVEERRGRRRNTNSNAERTSNANNSNANANGRSGTARRTRSNIRVEVTVNVNVPRNNSTRPTRNNGNRRMTRSRSRSSSGN